MCITESSIGPMVSQISLQTSYPRRMSAGCLLPSSGRYASLYRNHSSSPHQTIMGKREVRQMRQAVRRLAGQSGGSPTGEPAHGYARIRRAISPSPGKLSSAWPGLSPLFMRIR